MGGHSMGTGMQSMGMVGGRSVAAVPMSHAAFAPSFAHPHMAFAPNFAHPHHAFFHHHSFRNRLAYDGGGPYYYDDCSRQVWTRRGLQWVNVCYSNYNYGY
jgi:hypothetical protein